jgi:hypothetical protein
MPKDAPNKLIKVDTSKVMQEDISVELSQRSKEIKIDL